MSRPRVLTIYLDTWYGQGGYAPSSEKMQFGMGLFDKMGFEEVHVPMEWFVADDQEASLKRIEALIKAHYPYEWAFVVPFKTVDPIIKEICREAPLVAWMSDCVHRFSDFGRYWAGVSDFVVTTDVATLPKYGGKGLLSNWACRPEWAGYDVGQRLQSAGFQGQMYGKRAKILADIASVPGGIPVAIYDSAMPTDAASYFGWISMSELSLCLTEAISGKRQMKSRLFEPQVLDSVLVTEPVPRLEEYWEEGVECLVFRDVKDCQRQMRALLEDPDRLAAMQNAARVRALAQHTYTHRFEAILASIGVAVPEER